MKSAPITAAPARASYDVVIVGGATMGSATAWFLSANKDFNGSILVVERDNTLEWSATAHSNNCMRQQFATEINVRIGQYAAEFVKDFRANLGGDFEVPHLGIQNFGYLYLSDNKELSDLLIRDQNTQAACGAATQIMTPAGALPLNFPIEADDLSGAINAFGSEAEKALERTMEEIKDMQRQAASQIVVPGGANSAGGIPGGGIQIP